MSPRCSPGGTLLVGGAPFRLDEAAGGVEGVGPDVVEEPTQARQTVGPSPVQPPGALPALAQQASLLQDGEVLANRRAGDIEGGGDFAGGEFVVGDQAQDRTPSGLGQGPERVVRAVVAES